VPKAPARGLLPLDKRKSIRHEFYLQPDILSKLAKALDVEVFELFKADFVPFDSKVMMNQLSSGLLQFPFFHVIFIS